MNGMNHYNGIEWHSKRAKEWEILRTGVGKYTKEKEVLSLRALNPKRNDIILDVGTGTGFFARMIAKRKAKIIGIDMSENMLKIARELSKNEKLKMRFLKGNAEDLPFKDSTFDKIIAIDLIEHLKNPEIFIREASRVLKNDGKIVLSWPHAKSPYRMKYLFEKWVLNKSLPSTLWLPISLVEKWLRNYGFKVKKISTSLNVTAILVGKKH